jgi:hypothetical protein
MPGIKSISRFGHDALSRIGFGMVVPLDSSAPFGMRALKGEHFFLEQT